MKNDRLFQILYLLLERGTMTAPEISRALEVSVRTVYRDIDALSLAGVPVYATQGKNGGVSLMPNYSFDKALLSDEEQNQILYAIQSLRAVDQPVDALLNKLGGLFQKQNTSWIEVDFSRWGMGSTDSVKFERLKAALTGRRAMEIVYCSTSGETNRRVILPVKLIFKDKAWYLQAYCRMQEDYRLFKISRIVEMTVLEERFDALPDDLPPLEQSGYTMPMMQTVRMLFSSAVAFRVYDEFERDVISPQPDGTLCVDVAMPQDVWVTSYLLSFGTELTILEPEQLRMELAVQAKAIWERHAKSRNPPKHDSYCQVLFARIKASLIQEEKNMEERFCQSCGMPMGDSNELYGTEADGTKSKDYCNYCYDKGAFTADCTMQEMIDFCVKPMLDNIPGMTEEGARAMMNEHFPHLKRWQA